MQKFKNSIDLPAAAAEVVKLITTEDYLRFRYEDHQVKNFSLTIEQDDSTAFSYSLLREIDMAGKVPKMARKIVGDSMTVTQQQRWDRSSEPYPGTMTVEAQGLPGSISAATEVVAVSDNSSRLVVNGEVNVSIPLVGGQLEKLLVSRIEESFFQSGETVIEYIQRDK